jgi:hypothetical protein
MAAMSRRTKDHSLKDMVAANGDYIKWQYLPQINGYRIVSIGCDDERKNWRYVCYADPLGEKAAQLHLLKKLPPPAIFQLFGMRNIDSGPRHIKEVKFAYYAGDPTRPNPIITVRCVSCKEHFYFEPETSIFRNINSCEYGGKLAAIIGNKYNI